MRRSAASGALTTLRSSSPKIESSGRQIAVDFASDVAYYLTLDPRQLPSRYFYDALGSALFEAICRLPWYRITRAEQRLLAAHATEIFRRLAGSVDDRRAGPGSGEKLPRCSCSADRRAPAHADRPLGRRLAAAL